MNTFTFRLTLFCLVLSGLVTGAFAKDRNFSPMLGYQDDYGVIYGGFYSQYIPNLNSWHQVGVQISDVGYVTSYTVEKMPLSSHWDLNGALKYSTWKDPFFGLGNQTALADKVLVDNRQWTVDIDLKREFRVDLSVLISVYAVSRKENQSKNTQLFFKDQQLSGVGTGLEWDTRNQIINTQFGTYAKGKVLRISQFTKWDLDLRHFWSVQDRTVASRLVVGHIQGDQLPYVLRYKLGSSNLFLGASENRYNGASQVVWQQEYRQPFWRFIDIAGFYEFGQVGQTPSLSDLHSSYGVGFLFRFKESSQGLRFNIGRSGDDSRVSVSFNHVF